MKAFLTFIRTINNDIHMLGLSNPKNISCLDKTKLISGQPVIAIIESDVLLAFYMISNNGSLYQIKGNTDLLFELDALDDLTLVNICKYNTIRYFLCNIFDCLSIRELSENKDILEAFENKIFYSYLHTDTDICKFKTIINKELYKQNFELSLKTRMIKRLRQLKNPNNKTIKKKIDIDLSGYGIHINAKVS
jgi:hypothetical protein